MDTIAVPGAASDLTPEWLTGVLRSRGYLTAGSVEGLSIEEIGAGRGYVGLTLRLTPRYSASAAGDAPPSMVAKMPTFVERRDPADKLFADLLYSTEIHWYEALAPASPVRVPRCYWAGADQPRSAYCILLENLGDLRLTDQLSPCSIEDARLVVTELARLHAHWWNSPELERLDWLMSSSQASGLMAGLWQLGWEPFRRTFGSGVLTEYEEIGERTGAQMIRLAEQAISGAFTLAHGDFRFENFMFGPVGTRDALCVLDWQLITRGSGAMDFAYFLAQSLDTDFRRKHESELMDLYLAGLSSGGVTGYSRARFYADFRRGLLLAMAVPVNGSRIFEEVAAAPDAAAGGRKTTPEELAIVQKALETGARLLMEVCARNVAAILDHRASEVLA